MTARTTHEGDRTTVTVHPSLWALVVTIVMAITGASIWMQSQLSERPSRDETQTMIDRSAHSIEKTLTRIDGKVDKLDEKFDRIIDKQETR